MPALLTMTSGRRTAHGGGDQRVDVGALGDVALHGPRDVGTAELLHGGFGGVEVEVAEHDARTLGDEALGDREAQAPARPR